MVKLELANLSSQFSILDLSKNVKIGSALPMP